MPQHKSIEMSVEEYLCNYFGSPVVAISRRKKLTPQVLPDAPYILVREEKGEKIIYVNGFMTCCYYKKNTLYCTTFISSEDDSIEYEIIGSNGLRSGRRTSTFAALKAFCEVSNIPFTSSENGRNVFGILSEAVQAILGVRYSFQPCFFNGCFLEHLNQVVYQHPSRIITVAVQPWGNASAKSHKPDLLDSTSSGDVSSDSKRKRVKRDHDLSMGEPLASQGALAPVLLNTAVGTTCLVGAIAVNPSAHVRQEAGLWDTDDALLDIINLLI